MAAPVTQVGRSRALVLVVLSGLLSVGGLGASVPRALAAGGNEKCDLVGEDYHGRLNVKLTPSTFPDRKLLLTVPASSSVPSQSVHVYEDCQPVSLLALTPAGKPGTYEVEYRSGRPYGERDVELGIRVDGVDVFDLDYNSPQVSSAQTAAAAHGPGGRESHIPPKLAPVIVTKHKSFWASSRAQILIPALAAVLFALAFLLFMIPRRRHRDLRFRVAEYVPERAGVPTAPARPRKRFASTEVLLAHLSWWPSFRDNVDIAAFRRSPVELLALAVALTLATAGFVVALGVPLLSFLVVVLAPLALRALVHYRVRKQRELFVDQLPEHLDEFSSALRAGHGLLAGLQASVRSAPEPSRREWSRVLSDEALGMSLEAAMHSLARRMHSDDVEQIALVATLHQRTGGNMAEIIDRVTESVRGAAELRRELRALSAQARMSRNALTLMPPTLVLLMTVLNPRYMRPLFTTSGGLVALCIATTLLLCGSLSMRALTRFKV